MLANWFALADGSRCEGVLNHCNLPGLERRGLRCLPVCPLHLQRVRGRHAGDNRNLLLRVLESCR